ncbi:MAG: chorismate-binding protein, partial [Bacteroidales bacterium]|nr:chorismate-binding protein [Candidatus Cryptobacteroides caccocaballi]
MARYSYKTASKTLLGDMYTPVAAYLRLRDVSPQSILMESSDYHTGKNSHSYIALEPIAQVSIGHGTGRCIYPDGKVFEHQIGKDYMSDAIIGEFMRSFSFESDNEAALRCCQLWGFTSFNAVRYFEGIAVKDETLEKNDAPDMLYILFKYVIEFDHFNNRMSIHELLQEGETADIARIEHVLNRQNNGDMVFKPVGDVNSPLTDEQHKENIRKGIAHCKRGDVFQIVLSRRFVQKYEGDDFKLYRALRSINPSPYLFYMDFGGFRIFGSSPETHCRIEKGTAYIDPIAGTTRRTGNDEQDSKNAEYLRNDPKENAEHVMLVDLARNDLSRNCHGV